MWFSVDSALLDNNDQQEGSCTSCVGCERFSTDAQPGQLEKSLSICKWELLKNKSRVVSDAATERQVQLPY